MGITGLAGAGKDTVASFLVADFAMVQVSLADPLKRLCADVFSWDEDRLWGPSERRNEPDAELAGPYAYLAWKDARQNLVGEGQAWLVEVGLDLAFMAGLLQWFDALQAESRGVALTARRALQTLGTEFGRSADRDVWIRYAVRTMVPRIAAGGAYSRRFGIVGTGRFVTHGVVIPDVRFENEADAIHAAGGKVIAVHRPGAGLRGKAGAHASEAGIRPEQIDMDLDNSSTLERLATLVPGVAALAGVL